MRFVHYGATEPGSALEPNDECPVHFPQSRAAWLAGLRDRVEDHAPHPLALDMLRAVAALEAVEALIAPQWRSMDYDRNALIDDLRNAIDKARSTSD
jgi:hypothetical protein